MICCREVCLVACLFSQCIHKISQYVSHHPHSMDELSSGTEIEVSFC